MLCAWGRMLRAALLADFFSRESLFCMSNHPKATTLKTLLIFVLALLASESALAAQTGCPSHYAYGQAPDIINTRLATKTREICFVAFGVNHSGITRTPLWSAEHLTRAGLGQAKGLERVNSFHPEDRLPMNERAELSDYIRSGFDRGHMSPSADMPSAQEQHESFSLANMIPQNSVNNRHLWGGIESAVRTLTKRSGELYVVTGPVFRGGNLQQLNGRVMVPSHLFKAIYDPREGKSAAYLVANEATNDYKVVSIAELEQQIGIDAFPALSSIVKQDRLNLPAPTPYSDGKRQGHNQGHNQASNLVMHLVRGLLR